MEEHKKINKQLRETTRTTTIETTKHETTTKAEKVERKGSGVKSAEDRQESARTYNRSPRQAAPN